MDVRCFTVGPLQENCYVVRPEGGAQALVIDPGDESPRLIRALEALGVELAGILLTHTHFDHVGAVAPLARATGAEVWVPERERAVLADINAYLWPGFGPYEPYEAEHTVAGGEILELAGLRLEVLFTPGHSPGHVSFLVDDAAALLSGDVLFRGSVGRTDLPGGDWPTLLASIRTLVERAAPETTVYPGHMGVTTLGAERATNPFLGELAAR